MATYHFPNAPTKNKLRELFNEQLWRRIILEIAHISSGHGYQSFSGMIDIAFISSTVPTEVGSASTNTGSILGSVLSEPIIYIDCLYVQ